MKLYKATIESKMLYGLPAWYCNDLKLVSDVRKSVIQAATCAICHPANNVLESIADCSAMHIFAEVIVVKLLLPLSL